MTDFYTQLQEYTDNLLNYFFDSHKNKTVFLIVFHNLLMGLAIMYLLFGNINYFYFFVIGFMGLVLLLNILFRGCFLMKLERKYLNTKEWYGAYHMLEVFGLDLNNSKVKKLFYIWGLIIAIIPFIRIYNSYKEY